MSKSYELFSDIFAFRENRLSRLDPRVKLFSTFVIMLAVLLSHSMYLPLLAGFVCIGIMAALKIPLRFLMTRLMFPILMAGMIAILKTFLTGDDTLFTIGLGSWEISAAREGLQEGGLIGARVFGCVNAMLLLSMVTPAHRIFAALRWARVPHGWVETAMLMYRYIFVLIAQATDVFAAQRMRLGYTGLRRSLKSVGTLTGCVLDRALRQASRTHQAMVLRGFNGTLPMGDLPRLTPRELIGTVLFAGCTAVIYSVTEGWWTLG